MEDNELKAFVTSVADPVNCIIMCAGENNECDNKGTIKTPDGFYFCEHCIKSEVV